MFHWARGFGWRRRRRAYAGGASVLLHLLIFGLLLPWGAVRAPGAPGAAQGAGVDVSLVSAASLGLAAPHAPPMNAMTTTTPPTPPAAQAAPAPADAGETARAAFAANSAQPAPPAEARPQTVAWAADGTARLAAVQDPERRGAEDTAGGDPNAASELLAQIARCLPPQMRPRLPAHRLVLKIAANGALAAAPTVDSILPLLSAEDRAEADRVVQAALQCGPYARSAFAGQVVSLAVDFSGVGGRAP